MEAPMFHWEIIIQNNFNPNGLDIHIKNCRKVTEMRKIIISTVIALLIFPAWALAAWAESCAKLDERCSTMNNCCSGYSCQPGIQKCYHESRLLGEPCAAGYPCGSGLHCVAGKQKCAENR
jgi:hypothetical protein